MDSFYNKYVFLIYLLCVWNNLLNIIIKKKTLCPNILKQYHFWVTFDPVLAVRTSITTSAVWDLMS